MECNDVVTSAVSASRSEESSEVGRRVVLPARAEEKHVMLHPAAATSNAESPPVVRAHPTCRAPAKRPSCSIRRRIPSAYERRLMHRPAHATRPAKWEKSRTSMPLTNRASWAHAVGTARRTLQRTRASTAGKTSNRLNASPRASFTRTASKRGGRHKTGGRDAAIDRSKEPTPGIPAGDKYGNTLVHVQSARLESRAHDHVPHGPRYFTPRA